MKHKIGFKLNWLEMVMVLIMTFFAGFLISLDIEYKLLYTSMLILAVGNLLIKKRIKY